MDNILIINQVSMSYGSNTILNNLSFNLYKGSFAGFLGINGAGKTSLISAIAGLRSYSGKIIVAGHDLAKDPVGVKRNIGVVPQELSFDPFMSVIQTLRFQSKLYHVKNNEDWLSELLLRLHLKEKADTNTRNLSGGMKRRLMVAQALVHKPSLIILDEPTAGVDVEIRKLLWEFITEINRNGATILLTTHYLEEVEQLCSQVIMLHKGSMLYNDSKQSLIDSSAKLPSKFFCTINSDSIPETVQKLVTHHEEIGVYEFDNVSQNQISEILHNLYDAGIKIQDMGIAKPNLEDIFLKYLRRD
jgi:ABC-2 type transport system ATP-binding protein